MRCVETRNIKLLFGARQSDVLVVTFAHMDFDPNADMFWGESALVAAGYSGAGFVCKTNCWFPEADMSELLEAFQAEARSFRAIVLYGFSMGGYAAAKFSRLLGADRAIALSPQFSIDPAVSPHHNGWMWPYFQPALNHGMAVRPGDLGGLVYLFYDPHVVDDVWNCQQIAAAAGDKIRHIHVPHIGHETIDVFANSQLLPGLIELCRADDIPGLIKLSARSRRLAPRRMVNMLARLHRHHPAWANALFARRAAGLVPYWHQRWRELTAS